MPALASIRAFLFGLTGAPRAAGWHELREQLRNDFGWHRCAAQDADGVIVIGAGHVIDRRVVEMGGRGGLDDAVLTLVLEYDIRDATQLLHDMHPWTRDLSAARFGVLVGLERAPSLCAVMRWRPEFFPLLRTGDYVGAAEVLVSSNWARQPHNQARAGRLAEQLRTGQWPRGIA